MLSAAELNQMAAAQRAAAQVQAAAELELKARRERDARLEKARQARLARRREVLWRSLYAVAAKGETRAELANLEVQDVDYLASQGLKPASLFRRSKQARGVASEIQRVSHQLSTLQSKLASCESKRISPSWDPLFDWLEIHSWLAYACDLERWFGQNLDSVRISDLKDLRDLLATAADCAKRTKYPERQEALHQLIALVRLFEKPFLAHHQKQAELRKKIEQLETELQELESDPNYTRPEDVQSLHAMSWGGAQRSTYRAPPGEHSVWGLRFLSSDDGQGVLTCLGSAALQANNDRKSEVCRTVHPSYFFNSEAIFHLCEGIKSLGFSVEVRAADYRSYEFQLSW